MLICRTPFRISLLGGGTDFPEWYEKNNGITISFTFDKYCYVTLRKLSPLFNFKYRLRYFKNEFPKKINSIKHPCIKAVLEKYDKTNDPLEIIHSSDIPGLSGLGSSSAFTVSLINLILKHNNKIVSKKKLGNISFNLEKKILKENIGAQDSLACANGGFNIISYTKKNILIKNLNDSLNTNSIINNSLLVYTGQQRKSDDIEEDKIKNIKNKKILYQNLVELAVEGKKILQSSSDKFLIDFAYLLKENWENKKNLSKKVTNNKIDELYNFGLKNGAIAGKLLGAGGGGFMFFLCKSHHDQKFLMKQLKDFNKITFKLENSGSSIIYKSESDEI